MLELKRWRTGARGLRDRSARSSGTRMLQVPLTVFHGQSGGRLITLAGGQVT